MAFFLQDLLYIPLEVSVPLWVWEPFGSRVVCAWVSSFTYAAEGCGTLVCFLARLLFEAFFGKALFGCVAHVSGAVLRPSLYDLLCQVPDWLCGRLVFVVGDRSVDRLDPHGAYIDRTCSICGPNTVALHFLGMHLHPYSQR